MNVSAIIVTRGDVPLDEVVAPIPPAWQLLVWRNGDRELVVDGRRFTVPDLAVLARYEAVAYALGELIYVQDDDVVVSDPAAIVDAWVDGQEPRLLAANMPQEFRPHYPDSCLVGFGAVFHRSLPERLFDVFASAGVALERSLFRRTCDVVISTLANRLLLDVPKTNLPWAEADDRMYRQAGHVEERARMLELARHARSKL